MNRRILRLQGQTKNLPMPGQQPEPNWKGVEAATNVPRPVPVSVGSHATQKTPLPHMPEVHGEKALPDYHEMRGTEATTELEFEPAPEFPSPISVYVEESRNGDLMIRGFSTKITTVPDNTGIATCILSGSSRERSEVRIIVETAGKAIRIGPTQDLAQTQGFRITNGIGPEGDALPIQTEIWAISNDASTITVSILCVYEKVFFSGAQPHSRKRRHRKLLEAAQIEAADLAARMQGFM